MKSLSGHVKRTSPPSLFHPSGSHCRFAGNNVPRANEKKRRFPRILRSLLLTTFGHPSSIPFVTRTHVRSCANPQSVSGMDPLNNAPDIRTLRRGAVFLTVSVSDGHPPFFEEFSMYTMVLMMAASSAGESPDFFRRGGSCTGSAVAAVPAGCTGTVMAASAGCSGTSASCQGGSGFLGLRGKLFGGRGNGCSGSAQAMSGCHGTAFAPAMSGGCTGGTISGQVMMSGPVGCAPSMGNVMMPGTPVVMPPVVMPEVPKNTEPKKDPKKGSDL